MFSSTVAMALASSNPIQMGTVLFPSRSLSMTIGTLVNGSIAIPLIFISFAIGFTSLDYRSASPHRELLLALVILTGTIEPTLSGVPVKLTTLLFRDLPVISS
jgi:hypothetical protein